MVVSDGRSLVETASGGEFVLSAPAENALVWVRVPAGYRAAGPWHLPAGARDLTFRLERAPEHSEAFSFVFFTDIHLLKDRSDQPFARVLEEIEGLHPRPAFCVSGGDIELQAGMGEHYREMLDRFPIPVRHVPGNHDLRVGQEDPLATFRELFGPERYSWDWGRLHFVVLTGMVPNPAAAGWRNVEGELTEEELAWLEQDLRLAGRPSVLFLHIPPVSTFPQRRGRLPGQEPAWEVRRADRLLQLCAEHDVRLVLSGHFHENERIRSGETLFQTTAAVCGHWWEKGGRPALNLDGSPKGYRLIRVEGETIRTLYLPTGAGPDYQLRIVGPREGQEVAGRAAIGVNVFDGDRDTRVERRLDGGDWIPLRYSPQRARRNVFGSAHFWTGWAPPDLSSGRHVLTVRAVFPEGAAFEAETWFTVA